MKKVVVLILVVLFSVGVALAGGGKSCDIKASKAKNVELTGTISASGEHKVFRVSNAEGTQYTVCDESKADLSGLDNANVRIKGKVVKCGEGEELMIEKITKI